MLFSILRRLIFLVFMAVLGFGAYGAVLLHRHENLPTYREQIEYLIQHRTAFLFMYKTKILFWYHYEQMYPVQKTRTDSLFEWSEARVMYYLASEQIKSINDLPWLERSVIKTLDGSSYINKMAQAFFAPITRLFKSKNQPPIR